MERLCDVCDAQYVARRRTSRYCSPRCRMRSNPSHTHDQLRLRPGSSSTTLDAETTPRELEAAGRLNSSLGQQAILLAGRIGAPFDTGSSVAAVSRELRAVIAKALEDAQEAATRSINCGLGDLASLA